MSQLNSAFSVSSSSGHVSPQIAKDRITHLYMHGHANYLEYAMELIESEGALSGETGDTENTQNLAEELVQEAFVRAYDQSHLFEDPQFNIGAWLRDQIGHAYDRHKMARENVDSLDALYSQIERQADENRLSNDDAGFDPGLALHFNLQASDLDITSENSLIHHALEVVLEHDALPYEAFLIENCLKANDFHKLPVTVIPKLTRVLERMQDLPEGDFALVLAP